jgi:hypothetical protein
MVENNSNLEKKSVQGILDEDKDKIVSQQEIERIFRIHLDRIPTEQEISRFNGIKESEWKVIENYIKAEEDRNSFEADKLFNEEKGQADAMKIGGDLANKEMKVKGDQSLDALKNIAAVPGMAGPIAGMPSVVPPMPRRPMMDGQGGCGPKSGPSQKYIKDGKNFLIRFE